MYAVGKVFANGAFRGTAFAVACDCALTAFHCIGDRVKGTVLFKEVKIQFRDISVMADVAWRDPKLDVAELVLREKLPDALEPIRLGPEIPERGADRAFHSPGFPEALDGEPTIDGHISAVDDVSLGVPVLQLFCNQSAAASPLPLGGMSGSPVLVGTPAVAVGLIRTNPYTDALPSIAQGGIVWAVTLSAIAAANPRFAALLVSADLYLHRSLSVSSQPFALAPPLPRFYLRRDRELKAIAKYIAPNEQVHTGTIAGVVVQGQAGVGKTTIVAALAREPMIARVFPDGVLWAILGRRPNVVDIMKSWIRMLISAEIPVSDSDIVSSHLRQALASRACLIVLDDAWDAMEVRPLRDAAGKRCAVVVTTRRAHIADDLDAPYHNLDILAAQESIALLSLALRRQLSANEEQQAGRLSKLVGHLPIILPVIARRVEAGKSWTNLISALEGDIARLEVLASDDEQLKQTDPAVEAVLRSSADAVREYSPTVWERFVLLGLTPENARISAPMAATLWDTSVDDAAKSLSLLHNEALLKGALPTIIADTQWSAYTVHDLFHDIARRLLIAPLPTGLGSTLPREHRKLVRRYRAKCAEKWENLPDDGYGHAHLVWHMLRSEAVDEISRLLTQAGPDGANAWFLARARLGHSDGFISDLDVGFQVAQGAAALGSNAEARAAGLADMVRYELYAASVRSVAFELAPAIIKAFVDQRIWSPDEGLQYAKRDPNPTRRAETLYYISDDLHQLDARNALLEAFAIALEFSPIWFAVIDRLIERGDSDALLRAIGSQRDKFGVHLQSALERGAARGNAPLVTELIETHAESSVRARLWVAVLHSVSDPSWAKLKALQAIKEVEDYVTRSKFIIDIYAVLDEKERSDWLDDVLSEVLRDVAHTPAILSRLAKYVRLPTLFRFAKRIELVPQGRAAIYSAILPGRSHGTKVLRRFLSSEFHFDSWKLESLSLMMPSLGSDSDELCAAWLKTLAITSETDLDDRSRAAAIRDGFAGVPECHVGSAIWASRTIEDAAVRRDVFLDLLSSPKAPLILEHLDEVLSAVDDELEIAKVLHRALPQLGSSERTVYAKRALYALERVRMQEASAPGASLDVMDEHTRSWRAAEALALQVDLLRYSDQQGPPKYDELLAETLRLSGMRLRAPIEALAKCGLPAIQRAVVDHILTIDDVEERATLLSGVASSLTPAVLQEFAARLGAIRDHAVVELAVQSLSALCETSSVRTDTVNQREQLHRRIAAVSDGMRREAMSSSPDHRPHEIEYPWSRQPIKASALSIIARACAEVGDFGSAMHIIASTRIDVRALFQAEVAAYLPDVHRVALLEASLQIEPDIVRCEMLSDLLPLVPAEHHDTIIAEGLRCLKRERPEWEKAYILKSLLNSVCGERRQELVDEAKALQWGETTPCLDVVFSCKAEFMESNEFESAVKAARSARSGYARALRLFALAPFGATRLLADAIEAAGNLDKPQCAWLLSSQACRFKGIAARKIRERGLSVARSLYLSGRSEAFLAMALGADPVEKRELLSEAARTGDSSVFGALVPHMLMLPYEDSVRVLGAALRQSTESRPKILEKLRAFRFLLWCLGGSESLHRCALAVEECARFWP